MHTDVTQIITKTYPTLTEGGKKIADFLLAKPNEILALTVKTLAQKTGVSIATVSRFAQTLGFESFKQLQIAIASSLHEQDDYILNIHSDNHDPYAQIEKVANAESETISLSLKNLDKETLNVCADLLHKAKRIVFFGLGSSYFACEDAALKYKRLQKFAVALNNTHETAVTLSCLTQEDVVIGVSHSGETTETCKVLKLAQKRKVPTIAVTTFPSATINEFADYSLFTVTKEIPDHRIAFTSRISQLFLLDSLFLSTLYREKENNLEKIEQALLNISLTNV